MFELQGEKNFYWRTDDINDDNLYVEFKRELDLISATNRFIYYKHIKAYGISRSSNWPVKNQSLSHVNGKVNYLNLNQTPSPATGSNAILISSSKLNKRVIFSSQEEPTASSSKVTMPDFKPVRKQHHTLTTSSTVSKESERMDGC